MVWGSPTLTLHGGLGSTLKALGDVNIGASAELSSILVRDDAILSGGRQHASACVGCFRIRVRRSWESRRRWRHSTGTIEPTGPDKSGRINLENQSVFITDRLEAGVRGRGEVQVASGSSLSSREVVLGVDSGSTGKLTITGTDSQLLAVLGSGKVTVGDSGSGEMIVAAGSRAYMKELDVGASVNSIDTVTVTGVGSSVVAEHVGFGDGASTWLWAAFRRWRRFSYE